MTIIHTLIKWRYIMKKQELQVTANNRAVMFWVVCTVQNNERQIFGAYTTMSEACKAERYLEKQGFEISFTETCLEFGKDLDN